MTGDIFVPEAVDNRMSRLRCIAMNKIEAQNRQEHKQTAGLGENKELDEAYILFSCPQIAIGNTSV
jgi:hypothetical protein